MLHLRPCHGEEHYQGVCNDKQFHHFDSCGEKLKIPSFVRGNFSLEPTLWGTHVLPEAGIDVFISSRGRFRRSGFVVSLFAVVVVLLVFTALSTTTARG